MPLARSETDDLADFSAAHAALHRSITSVIRGKDEIVDLVLLALVADGHLLLEDVPGVGKTTLAKALARSIDAVHGRIQFTPDLLPTDIIGVNIWRRGAERFELNRGPVFSNVVLADEINRASPKAQSALLEAMEEHQVTIDDRTHRLASPFIVIATQNPIDHAGTHPLPESQLDRFLMRLSLGYPDRTAEFSMLDDRPGETALTALRPVIGAERVETMIATAAGVFVAPRLRGYLLDLITATRAHRLVAVGASPRAGLALQRAARARAASRGRPHVVPDDIKALAVPVLAHRLVLRTEARRDGVDPASVITEILRTLAVPDRRATGR